MDAVIGLGSNLGDRRAALSAAVHALFELARILAVSSLYETEPVGPPQPAYLNAALRIERDGTPRELLDLLLGVERRLGRVRAERWGPRTLDLDILWISGVELVEANLVVPHPGLASRRFALEPLLEVAPDARHPATGAPLSTWLESLPIGGALRVSPPEWAGLPAAAR